MTRVIANWVLYRLDCGHLVSDSVDSTVKYAHMCIRFVPSGKRMKLLPPASIRARAH